MAEPIAVPLADADRDTIAEVAAALSVRWPVESLFLYGFEGAG